MTSNEITPTTTAVTITPNMAKSWLENNTNNRPVAPKVVERYMRDMLSGLWHFTPAAIGFDTDGNMIDGQHRLHAIANLPEGHSVTMNVTHGLDPQSKFYIDQGRRRTPGNQLSMLGIKNYNHNAAGARQYLLWSQGLIFKDSSKAQLITSPQIQEWVENHMDLVELANQSHRDLIRNDARPAINRAAFFRFATINVEDAVTFFSRLHSGASLHEGNPILALKQRLETDRRTSRKRTDREQLGMLITAWNSWRKGKNMKSISSKSWTIDNFPKPI